MLFDLLQLLAHRCLQVTNSDAPTIVKGSEVQSGLKCFHYRGCPPLARPLVLTPPSTSTVPATRKIYNASLQTERYSQAPSQCPRLSTRTSIGFPRLNDPGQVQACGGGRRQAAIRTQGHGCSVQGNEAAASSDVQHQVSDLVKVRPLPSRFAYANQGHQTIWEESNHRPGEDF